MAAVASFLRRREIRVKTEEFGHIRQMALVVARRPTLYRLYTVFQKTSNFLNFFLLFFVKTLSK